MVDTRYLTLELWTCTVPFNPETQLSISPHNANIICNRLRTSIKTSLDEIHHVPVVLLHICVMGGIPVPRKRRAALKVAKVAVIPNGSGKRVAGSWVQAGEVLE